MLSPPLQETSQVSSLLSSVHCHCHHTSHRIQERTRAASAYSISRFLRASHLKMIIFRRMLITFSLKRARRMIRRSPNIPSLAVSPQLLPNSETAWPISAESSGGNGQPGSSPKTSRSQQSFLPLLISLLSLTIDCGETDLALPSQPSSKIFLEASCKPPGQPTGETLRNAFSGLLLPLFLLPSSLIPGAAVAVAVAEWNHS
jgi:hypothetical protein